MADPNEEKSLPPYALDLRPGLRCLQHRYDFRPLGRDVDKIETRISFRSYSIPGMLSTIYDSEEDWMVGGDPDYCFSPTHDGYLSFRPEHNILGGDHAQIHMVYLTFSSITPLDEFWVGKRSYKGVLGKGCKVPLPGQELTSMDQVVLTGEDTPSPYYFHPDSVPETDPAVELMLRGLEVRVDFKLLNVFGDEDG